MNIKFYKFLNFTIMFNKKINEVTGYPQVSFNGKLTSISEKVLMNKNDKPYKVGTVVFKDKEGKSVKATGLIYDANYSNPETGEPRMESGREYLCTATSTEEGVLITISHLEQASRPTKDMFDFSITEVSAEKAEIAKSL